MVRTLGVARWVRRRLPGGQERNRARSVVALVVALVAVAAGGVAWSEQLAWTAPGLALPWALGLFAALTVAACSHVEFRHDEDDVDGFDLFEVALAPALLLVPGVTAVLLVAGAKLVSQTLLRVPPLKLAFNVASWCAGAALGSVVVRGLAGGPGPGSTELVALLAAMVVVAIVNDAAFVAVLRVAQRRPLAHVIAQIRPTILPAWILGEGVMVTFGVLFAAACAPAPGLTWLLVVPLAALHWASQRSATTSANLIRSERLHRATTELAASPDPVAALPTFLEQVRAAFEASAVHLVGSDGLRAATDGAGTDDDLADAVLACDERARVTALCRDPAIAAALRRCGWRDALIARVPGSGPGRRVLCVFDPKGVVALDEVDARVVADAARELGGVLVRSEAEAARHRSEERFRALVQESSDMVVVTDAAGVAIDVLPSASASPIRLDVGSPLVQVAHPDDVALVQARLGWIAARPGSSGSFTWRATSAAGSWRHLETSATNLLAMPAVGGIVLHLRDVTGREQAMALVRGQAEVLDSISRRRPLLLTLETLAAAAAAQAPGARLSLVLVDGGGGRGPTVLGAPLPAALAAGLVRELVDGANQAPGERRPVLIVPDVVGGPWSTAGAGAVGAVWATTIDRGHGSPRGLAVLHFDHPRGAATPDRRVLESVADLAHIALETDASEARLVHLATHDPLTGLPNRVLFLDRTQVALSRLARTGRSVAVLFVDLDRFKTVNDSLGHDVGDRLLIDLARRLEDVMRPSDTVARFGGDEFTILCTDLPEEREAKAIASRVRAALARPVILEGHELYVTASVGIAHTRDGSRAAHELIEEADAAMYLAKGAGGDVQQVYDQSVRSRALLDIVTYEGLRKAIARDELVLHYQTIVDVVTGHVVGVEALVRWNHPELGLVAPDAFIPLAEATGLIVPVGAHVLQVACEQSRRWDDAVATPSGLVMNVNISARQFADPGLADVVADALDLTGASPGALALEITESALMADTEATKATLQRLQELGVRIVIDDFGTGYSSLTYLKHLHADVIKLDKSFVAGIAHARQDEVIVASVINLAHTLGMRTVAEGVETDAQLAVLRRLRCDVAQGYWFSRPVAAEAVDLGSRRDEIDLAASGHGLDLRHPPAVARASRHPRVP